MESQVTTHANTHPRSHPRSHLCVLGSLPWSFELLARGTRASMAGSGRRSVRATCAVRCGWRACTCGCVCVGCTLFAFASLVRLQKTFSLALFLSHLHLALPLFDHPSTPLPTHATSRLTPRSHLAAPSRVKERGDVDTLLEQEKVKSAVAQAELEDVRTRMGRLEAVYADASADKSAAHEVEKHNTNPWALNPKSETPAPCTLHPTPHTLHPTPHTLHPAPYTLRPAPYTLHPAPYILYSAPYTLHPTP